MESDVSFAVVVDDVQAVMKATAEVERQVFASILGPNWLTKEQQANIFIQELRKRGFRLERTATHRAPVIADADMAGE